MSTRNRKLIAKYAKAVVRNGPHSPAAVALMKRGGGDPDFEQLARVANFFFEQADLQGLPRKRPAVVQSH